MQSRLNKSLSNDYRFHVQPVFDVKDMRLSSVELLLRGQDGAAPRRLADLGRDHPALASRLDGKLLVKAAREALPELMPYIDTVSFNCSARFVESGEAAVVVAALTKRRPDLVDGLVFEVAMNSLPPEPARFIDQVRRLRQWGLRMALDNVNLAELAPSFKAPEWVDQVKLDAASASLLRHQHDDSSAAANLYQNAVQLASEGVEVVFKHIEDTEQLIRARAAGCGLLQGNATGRPLDCPKFIQQRRIVMASLVARGMSPACPPSSKPPKSEHRAN